MADQGPRHLVSYFGNRYLHHFERDLDEMRAHGFDAVVHCVTEADREWGMRRIAEMFAMTRDAGLSCWADPWGVARVFGGEAHSGYLARGGTVGADDAGLRALLHNWIDDVAAAGAEWLFWDEPDLGAAGGEGALVPFLQDLCERARERGLRNSVCLTSTVPNIPAFPRLAALDSVDDIGTDPYYKLASTTATRTPRTTSACGPTACGRWPTRTARPPTYGCRPSTWPPAARIGSAAASRSHWRTG